MVVETRRRRVIVNDENGNNINPATEEKQNSIIAALGGSVAYDILIDKTTTTDITYIGKAAIGTATSSALWQLSRLNKTSSITQVGWADSDEDFDNIWDNRVSLSYSK
jgi:hypothetical protein